MCYLLHGDGSETVVTSKSLRQDTSPGGKRAKEKVSVQRHGTVGNLLQEKVVLVRSKVVGVKVHLVALELVTRIIGTLVVVVETKERENVENKKREGVNLHEGELCISRNIFSSFYKCTRPICRYLY